jgi:transcriptional regulator with XRE-family HTH domain
MRRLVGQNVRRIRQRKGLTQEKFAELSGFSQQYISSLEQGRRNPTVITVYELAIALGVSHMDLVRLGRINEFGPSVREHRLIGRQSGLALEGAGAASELLILVCTCGRVVQAKAL